MPFRSNVSRRAKLICLALLAALGFTLLTACGTTTPEAMCAFVVGNGSNGNDTKLHKAVLPGNDVGDLSGETARFVPCNSRNYSINDGSVRKPDGSQVGDRFNPTIAYTKQGTPVSVWSDSFWTLNENDATLRHFYELCYKYTCFSTDNTSGTENFSTPGWNGMLAENFGPTMDEIIIQAMPQMDDAIWSDQAKAPQLREDLGNLLSTKFKEALRKRIGYTDDIFCGSGSSVFKDPAPTVKDQPRTDFDCTNVRIVIPQVRRITDAAVSTPQSQQQLNAERLAAAKALYGDNAGYWLGVQDTCKAAAPQPCTIVVGGNGSAPVPVASAPSAPPAG